jgi:hypothetical protein
MRSFNSDNLGLTVRDGHHLANSLHQLPTVDLGTMTMLGPLMFLPSLRYARREIVCHMKVAKREIISTVFFLLALLPPSTHLKGLSQPHLIC